MDLSIKPVVIIHIQYCQETTMMLKAACVLAFAVYASYEVARFWSHKTDLGVEMGAHYDFLNRDATKEIQRDFAHRKGFEHLDGQFQLSNAMLHVGLWITAFVRWSENITVVDLGTRARDWFLSTAIMQLINPQNTWMQVATPILLVIMFCYVAYCIKEYLLTSSAFKTYAEGRRQKNQARQVKAKVKAEHMDDAKTLADQLAASLADGVE